MMRVIGDDDHVYGRNADVTDCAQQAVGPKAPRADPSLRLYKRTCLFIAVFAGPPIYFVHAMEAHWALFSTVFYTIYVGGFSYFSFKEYHESIEKESISSFLFLFSGIVVLIARAYYYILFSAIAIGFVLMWIVPDPTFGPYYDRVCTRRGGCLDP